MKNSFPTVPSSLLKELNVVFPKKDHTPNESLRDIDYHSGQRSVVKFLEHQFNIQNENILTKE
jgi:hypothetical protein